MITIDINRPYVLNKNITTLKDQLIEYFTGSGVAEEEIELYYFTFQEVEMVRIETTVNYTTYNIVLKLNVKSQAIEDTCNFIKINSDTEDNLLEWNDFSMVLEIFDHYFHLTEEKQFKPAY